MPSAFSLAGQAFYASLGVTTGLLGLIFCGQRQWEAALAVLVVGAGWGGVHWIAARRPGWRWMSPLAFAALVMLAAYGLWHQAPAAWLVVGVAAALVTWDLDGFAARLAPYAPLPDEARLVRLHLVRLLLVAGAGVGLGEAALHLRLTLGLGVAAGLGLLAFLFLTQAARRLGRDEEPPPGA